MNKHFIELNGKRYDAITGALIGNVEATQTEPASTAHTPTTAPAITPSRPSRAHHVAPKHLTTRKPQSPKTLMRHVVSKPTATTAPSIKQQYPVISTASGITVPRKSSAATMNDVRFKRAQQIHKSSSVARFSQVKKVVRPLAVATPPTAHTQHPVAHPQTPNKVNVFDHALAQAKSHEQPARKIVTRKKQHRRRMVNALASLAAVLVIGGFVAYMNKASIQLEYASLQAGFQATMPSYVPEGYQKQSASGEKNKVIIGFVAPISNDQLQLTQESSNWDSQKLFDNLVATDTNDYQTIQSNSNVIYLYGNNQAAWVSGGILYKVSSSADIDSSQIISLASSM